MSFSTLQDAKDTFYLALRDRLAALNPDRTVVVRGATRPGILVQENEVADGSMTTAADVFTLVWTSCSSDESEAMPLERGLCEVHYGTRGLPEVAGMDRGRALQAMDWELRTILRPASAALLSFTGPVTGTPLAGSTIVFWSDPVYGEAGSTADRLEQVVSVNVFAWREDL